MNDVHKSLLELLGSFQKICGENNLKYYASGGTLLGAVRHQGFIPWDDDIDLFMPRDDYEKLFKKVELDSRYKVEELDGIGHFVDTSIYISHGNEYWDKRYPNLSIDLFPLDGSPNIKPLRFIHITYCLMYFAIFKFKNIEYAIETESLKNRINRSKIEKWLIKNGKFFHKFVAWIDDEKFNKRFKELQMKYSFRDSDYVGVYCGRHRYKEFFHKRIIGTGKRVPFEDGWVMIFNMPENWLTKIYGDEYMKLPDEIRRERHGCLRIMPLEK